LNSWMTTAYSEVACTGWGLRTGSVSLVQ